MFAVKLDRQPFEFLKKCEKVLFARLSKKIDMLKENPVPPDAKRLAGYYLPTFRVGVGKYRILYRVSYENKMIVLVIIDSRERAYL